MQLTAAKDYSLNLHPAPTGLLDACQEALLAPQTENSLSAKLVIWEASARQFGSMNTTQAEELTENVRRGSSLLLTLDTFPGTTPVLLGGILPTTGWGTQLRHMPYMPANPLVVGDFDKAFYPPGSLAGMSVPYFFDIRSTSAVERGQSKYERYAFVHPILKTPVPAGSRTWTRSLLNRDWRIAVRGDDLAQMPLLVTGRYGAGRVAMIATGVHGIEASRTAAVFWRGLLAWLLASDTDRVASPAKIGLQLHASSGFAHVSLQNPTPQEQHVQVVMRATSVAGAMLPDGQGEHLRSTAIAPHASSTLKLPLPVASEFSTNLDGACHLRVGVLSADGGTLLAESQLAVDTGSPIRLSVHTDNIEQQEYPFHAPGPNGIPAFRSRMGMYVGAYAYKGGEQVSGEIEIANGFVNLAPQATVRDLTTPANPSVMALNDESAVIRKGPDPDNIEAYAMWTGASAKDNTLEFHLPTTASVSEIQIIGSPNMYQSGLDHNPGAVIVELDGRRVAAVSNLDELFVAGSGEARISFPLAGVKVLTLRFPWIPRRGIATRGAPWLGEIRILGWIHVPPQNQTGRVTWQFVDAMSGRRISGSSLRTTVLSNQIQRIPFQLTLPQTDQTRFLRIEVSFGDARAQAPILVITPKNCLLPLTDLKPDNAAGLGLIVSRGFRDFFHIGTGVAETVQSWGQPDDLVWSYSRQLKRIYVKDRTKADRLFVTESDLRHYITPWRSFPNGKMFFFESIQSLVDNLHASANWNHSKRVVLFFADCWDGGPDMTTLNGWQDFVEFDKWLRLSGDSIQARTRTDIAAEIHSRHEDAWQSWQLDRYVQCVQAIREAFSTAGKTVVISSQVVPMVAGVQGAEIACTYRGMADDSTWSMLENSPVLTTGRQLSLLAFNPVWEMTTLIAWGYNSSLFNPWQWHSPVGTAEPSRRHIYNRAWRATLWPDGRYASVYTYGYSQNVGTSFLMTEEDYQEWWYIQERHSLISPEAPIGAGILISTQKSSDPRHIRFNCGDPLVLEEALIVTKTFELLHNAGISIPFAANVSALPIWESTAPLIVLNLPDFSDNEVASLAAFHARGVPIVAFAERSSLTDEMSTLFSKPETLLIEIRCSSLTRIAIEQSATQLRGFLKQAVLFPPGTAGYGFRSQGVAYFVLEDWLEKTRPVDMLIAKSADARSATACSVNRHAQLQVTDAGAHWSVRLRLQSGDGELIALEERFS